MPVAYPSPSGVIGLGSGTGSVSGSGSGFGLGLGFGFGSVSGDSCEGGVVGVGDSGVVVSGVSSVSGVSVLSGVSASVLPSSFSPSTSQ